MAAHLPLCRHPRFLDNLGDAEALILAERQLGANPSRWCNHGVASDDGGKVAKEVPGKAGDRLRTIRSGLQDPLRGQVAVTMADQFGESLSVGLSGRNVWTYPGETIRQTGRSPCQTSSPLPGELSLTRRC